VATDVSALRIGDLASPTDFRTTRQNDGRRHPGRSAERHLRVRSCDQRSTLAALRKRHFRGAGLVDISYATPAFARSSPPTLLAPVVAAPAPASGRRQHSSTPVALRQRFEHSPITSSGSDVVPVENSPHWDLLGKKPQFRAGK